MYDGKGNVAAVIDSAQNVVASYRYDGFGRLMAKSGSLDQPYQFSTKRYFADVGLNYYGYRFYAPPIGRWMNRDPIGEAGGLNLYGFVQNNPINLFDPWGLWPPTNYQDNNLINSNNYFHNNGRLPGSPDPNLRELDLDEVKRECSAMIDAAPSGPYESKILDTAVSLIQAATGLWDLFTNHRHKE